MRDERNWNDPHYKEWRLKVYKRDKFMCQMPGCSKKGFKAKIQAHHIKRWADFPELRFEISNGITLCKLCHDRIGTQESSYEPLFINILSKKKSFPDSKPISSLKGQRLRYCSEESENSNNGGSTFPAE